MSFTPAHARLVYDETQGADPLFASVDGANCPGTVRTDRPGHGLILGNGLLRIGLAMRAIAEYSILLVRDPTGCALRLDPQSNLLTASATTHPTWAITRFLCRLTSVRLIAPIPASSRILPSGRPWLS